LKICKNKSGDALLLDVQKSRLMSAFFMMDFFKKTDIHHVQDEKKAPQKRGF
jgi:hypothetical protein